MARVSNSLLLLLGAPEWVEHQIGPGSDPNFGSVFMSSLLPTAVPTTTTAVTAAPHKPPVNAVVYLTNLLYFEVSGTCGSSGPAICAVGPEEPQGARYCTVRSAKETPRSPPACWVDQLEIRHLYEPLQFRF